MIDELVAPALWETELTNVLWLAVRKGILQTDDGIRGLSLAARLRIRSVPSRLLWQGAFVRAVNSGAAVHDTRFVELAHREGAPLVTFAANLCETFPAIAKRPTDLLSK